MAFRMAFSGGSVMGLAVASLGLFGIGLIYFLGVHQPAAFMDAEILAFSSVIAGYAMGAGCRRGPRG
jgi:Na+/H+-translocating membrane pyrophosphatase